MVCIKLPLQQTAIEVRKRAARVCRANRLRIAPHCLGDHSASLCVCAMVLCLVVDHGIDFVMTLLDQSFAFDANLRLLVLTVQGK